MKNKSLNLANIIGKFDLVFGRLKQYSVIIFIFVFFGIYGFLIYRVNSLIQMDPNSDSISAKQQTIQRLKIDQASVDKILLLKDNSVEVQSLFKQARDNPFQE